MAVINVMTTEQLTTSAVFVANICISEMLIRLSTSSYKLYQQLSTTHKRHRKPKPVHWTGVILHNKAFITALLVVPIMTFVYFYDNKDSVMLLIACFVVWCLLRPLVFCKLDKNRAQLMKPPNVALGTALNYWQSYLKDVSTKFDPALDMKAFELKSVDKNVNFVVKKLILIIPNQCDFPKVLYGSSNDRFEKLGIICQVPLDDHRINRREAIVIEATRVWNSDRSGHVDVAINFPQIIRSAMGPGTPEKMGDLLRRHNIKSFLTHTKKWLSRDRKNYNKFLFLDCAKLVNPSDTDHLANFIFEQVRLLDRPMDDDDDLQEVISSEEFSDCN